MSDVEPIETWIRLSGASLFLAASGTSILANMVLACILLTAKDLRQQPFYIILMQLLLSDMFGHVSQLAVAVPLTFAGHNLYGSTMFFYAPIEVGTAGFLGLLFFNVLLTINRLCVFFVPSLYNFIFSTSGICGLVSVTWLFVAVTLVTRYFSGCRSTFSAEGLYYFHDCIPNRSGWAYVISEIGLSFATTIALPLSISIAYVVIYFKIRKDTGGVQLSKESARMERLFFVQGFFISGTFIVSLLLFYAVVFLPPRIGQWTYVVNIVTNLIIILSNSTHPIIMFSSNTALRRRLTNLRGWRKGKTAVTPMPSMTRSVV